MRRYEGKHPCPGCGLSGEENPRNLKDELCYDCKKLLEFGREQKELVEQRPPEMPYVKVSIPWYTLTGKIQLSVSSEGDIYSRDTVETRPKYRVPYISDRDFEHNNSKTLLKAYQEFIESIAINDSTKQLIGTLRFGDDSRDVIGLIPVNVARKFVLFIGELTKVFEAEKLIEKDKALKFLQELNTGSISLAKFDEENGKLAKKIQELKYDN